MVKNFPIGPAFYKTNGKKNQPAWMISTEAGKDVCEAAITEVYKEMKILREELVEDDELLLVKNFLIGTVLGDLDGPFHFITRCQL